MKNLIKHLYCVGLIMAFLLSSFGFSTNLILECSYLDISEAPTCFQFSDGSELFLQAGQHAQVIGYDGCLVKPLGGGGLFVPFTKKASRKITITLRRLEPCKVEYCTLAALPLIRKSLYDELASQIGNTGLSLYEESNGNRIWLKHECDNLFESHYDRVYLALFRIYEEQGLIKPGCKVLETTSGSAGISFAGIGRKLGYDCYVALPAGGEKAREVALKNVGATIIFTDRDKYISAFPEFVKDFLHNHKDYFFLNHSMGKKGSQNEVSLAALEGIIAEVKSKLRIDFFLPAVGNGSSVLGPGRVLDSWSKLVAFESVQSAVMYELMYPGQYQDIYGIKPGTLSRHRLPGTSFNGITFPHIVNAVGSGIVNRVVLVSDEKMDQEYFLLTGKTYTEHLPHWDKYFPADFIFGRSTRCGIAVARELAKSVKDKNFLVIAYDKANRYDS